MQCALCGEKGTSFLGRRQYSLCCAKLVVQGGPLARVPRLVAHAPQVYNLEDWPECRGSLLMPPRFTTWRTTRTATTTKGPNAKSTRGAMDADKIGQVRIRTSVGAGLAHPKGGRLWQNSEHGIPKGEVVHVFEFGRIFDHGTQRGETLPGCWPQGRSALSTF